MDQTLDRPRDLPTEVRGDFIREHRARVSRTEGELNQRARDVRAHLAVLQQHQQRAYREDVLGVLGELGYALGTHSTGNPAIYFDPMADSAWAEELMILGGELRTRLPRKFAAILSTVRLDLKRCVLWFDLPREPEGIPYEAAA